MKFCINNIFLLSLIFGKTVYADLREAKGKVIKDEYIVVYDERHPGVRRRLGGTDSFGTSGGISANLVQSLANEIGKNVGVSSNFKVAGVYANTLVGFNMIGTQNDAEKIAADKYISYVEYNQVVEASQVTWGIDRVDQRDLPLDNTFNPSGNGSGVAAYIIDTGVRTTHEEFAGRSRWGINTSGDSVDEDCNGHGTHVAGTVGGSVYGVAKGVEIIAVKVLQCSGSGSTAGVIAGVDWVAQDAAAQGKPATANMSLGGGFSQASNDAVKALNDSGVPTVVAAGNDNGNACNKSPASEPTAITVGSTTNTDTRSSFSNYGTCVDIFAPGSGITAAWKGSDSDYNTISGTSMASPHVCGGVALLLQAGVAPANIAGEIVSRATSDKVTNPQTGSPNKLLFVGAVGPTNAPTPAPPTPAPTPCVQTTVKVEVTTDNYPAETAWTLTNNCNNILQESQSSFPAASTTYSDELCVSNAAYTFTIKDTWGDGMCCGYGQGSYTLTVDDDILKQGGQFGNAESTTFGICTAPPTLSPVAADDDLADDDLADDDEVEEECHSCTDIPTNGMVKKGKTCDTNPKRLNRQCNKNDKWTEKNSCQLSCYKSGNGYLGDNCCLDE